MLFPLQFAALDVQTMIVIIIGILFVFGKLFGFLRNFASGSGGTPPLLTGAPSQVAGGTFIDKFISQIEQYSQSQMPPLPVAEPDFAPPILKNVRRQHLPPVPQNPVLNPARPAKAASGHEYDAKVHISKVNTDVAAITKMLGNPITARQAVIASVILGRPVSESI